MHVRWGAMGCLYLTDTLTSGTNIDKWMQAASDGAGPQMGAGWGVSDTCQLDKMQWHAVA
jgi:hypothetical protein